MRKSLAVCFVFLAAPLGLSTARADIPPGHRAAPPPTPAVDPAPVDTLVADPAPEEESAFAKLGLTPKPGPLKVPLGHQLTIDLPAGYLFLDANDSRKFATALHNVPEAGVVGTILKEDAEWFIEVSYDEDGYVKDDEAEKIDADAILQSYKDGTEAANAERIKGGGKSLHVEGWAENPRYEKSSHHLVWALIGASEDGKTINFNTRILGRKGYASLNLIASPDELPAAKPDVAQLLTATTFDQGSRYEDFQPKSDKVAEYGIAALVAGGAGLGALKLVKIGLLAKFGAVILKGLAVGGKAIVLAIVGLFAAIRRFFTGKKTEGQ